MTLSILAALLALAALFSLLNVRFLGLPNTAGLIVLGLAASAAVAILDAAAPNLGIAASVRGTLAAIDFRALLLDGFLSALLFAGAIHVELADVARKKLAVGVLSTVGVLVATAVTGVAMFAAAQLLGQPLPMLWALAFGALISPTDPVAVLALLKTVRIPATLHAKLAAEALFNDGVGIVVFTVVLAAATGSSAVGFAEAGKLFLLEAVGGAALGLSTGWLACQALRGLADTTTPLMITLALVAGTYALALQLGLSGPIAEVVAGLMVGNQRVTAAAEQDSRDRVMAFWELTEDLLNSVLFLLIGLEVLLVGVRAAGFGLALAAIPIALGARYLAVALPLGVLSRFDTFSPGAVPILTWAGLRGGISVALALSLPETASKPLMLTAAYAVVVFTVVVQGITMPAVIRRYYPNGV